jgi:hypothetical protein
LRHSGLTEFVVLLALEPCRLEGLRAVGEVSLGPEHVAYDAVVASLPAKAPSGFEGSREVAGEAGEVRQAASCCGCEPSAAGGDVLHAAPGVLAASEVAVCLGQVVLGHLVELARQ